MCTWVYYQATANSTLEEALNHMHLLISSHSMTPQKKFDILYGNCILFNILMSHPQLRHQCQLSTHMSMPYHNLSMAQNTLPANHSAFDKISEHGFGFKMPKQRNYLETSSYHRNQQPKHHLFQVLYFP